jgi:hypothetical protein
MISLVVAFPKPHFSGMLIVASSGGKKRGSRVTKPFRAHVVASLLAAIWLVLPPSPAPAYVTMVNNGPSANRVDIVFLGDGYLASDLSTTYVNNINSMVSHLFSQDPFGRYSHFFNIHRIDVVSNQRGADVPPQGIYRDTALDASYYYDNVTDRLLYINEYKANTALANGLAGAGFSAEIRLVTVNDTLYGGGGVSYAVYAGGNSSATELATHELGHSFAGLADEYQYSNGTTYSGSEPSQPNVTTDPAGAKWSAWLGYNDPQLGVVGAYEGGLYADHGIYRPSLNSKMRSLGQPFDAISREQIILNIYKYVRPLDSFESNAATLVNPSNVWVDTVDPAVIDVDWSVNGNPVSLDSGGNFCLRNFGYEAGTFSVTARAYDPTDWVRADRSSLEQSVSWTVRLYLPGDANEDDKVSFADYLVMEASFGKSGSWTSGDFNGDGKVSFADYLQLESHFGRRVPEPAGAALLLLAAVGMRRRRFNRPAGSA